MSGKSAGRQRRAEQATAAEQDAKSKKTRMKRNIPKIDDADAFTLGDKVRANKHLEWTANQRKSAKVD